MPGNFSTERAYSGEKELYPKWKVTDKSLDDAIDPSFGRDSITKLYIVRFRSNWEADEDLQNLSAEMIAEKGIITATLKERLLLGDFLFWKHQRHLDVKNITLCAGSRYSGGGVPEVNWFDGELWVDGYGPGRVDSHLRSRRAVV